MLFHTRPKGAGVGSQSALRGAGQPLFQLRLAVEGLYLVLHLLYELEACGFQPAGPLETSRERLHFLEEKMISHWFIHKCLLSVYHTLSLTPKSMWMN